MKQRLSQVAIELLCCLSFVGCRNGSVSILPTSTGMPSEVLVVYDDKTKASEAGKALIDVLLSDVAGLPQEEPNFNVSSVSPSQFDNLLKPVRNILIIEVSDIYSATKMTYSRNLWADSQMVMYIKSPSHESLLEYVTNNQQTIIDFFVNAEINRFIKLQSKKYNKAAKDSLMTQLGIGVNIPGELKTMKQGENFFWISNNQYRSRLDFVAYTVPYTSANQLEENNLIAMRDSVMKANIPGGVPGSYMTTEDLFTPVYRAINIGGKFCAQLKGLWEMQGDMMGGPFVSHTLVDDANNRLITVEVFVYAPEEKKRNLMRRLESTLYTLQIPQQNMLPEIPITVPSNNND